MWYVRSGSRVTGPFTEAQLNALRKRGQFTPVQQVSVDRVRWESAASLVKLLDGKPEGDPSNVASHLPGAENSSNGPASPTDPRWFYLDANHQKVGPCTLESLNLLIQSGALTSATLVCAKGDVEWVALGNHPILSAAMPSRSSWTLFILISVLAIAIVGGLGWAILQKDKTSDSGPPAVDESKDDANKKESESDEPEKKSPGSDDAPDSLLITTLKDEDRIKQAVGLVVCGERWRLPDGTVIEDPVHDDYTGYGKGTCFNISPTGFLLTNRHVVANYSPAREMNRKLNGKTYSLIVDYPVVVFFNRIRFDAKVMHIDQTYDLAVLKIERLRPQPYFAVSSKSTFNRGEHCFALGFPGVANRPRSEEEKALLTAKAKNTRFENMLLDQNFDYSYQGGEVSRVIRDGKQHVNIEHSAKIFRGNSGGPLVDSHSVVIGINTLITSDLQDTLYIAFATGQFRDIVDEFTGGAATWKD